jgi:hypothetical protein
MPPIINKWLRCADIHPRIKFLHLLFNFLNAAGNPCDHLPHVPSSVYRCKNLLVLKFHCVSIKCFPFTKIVEFPQLKTLHLEDINFKTHSLFTLFLAGCPVLEDLKVCEVFFDVEKGECQAAERLNLSKLIRADITDCWCLFPMISLSNSEFLRIYVMEYFDVAESDVELPIFHNLTHLVINNISNELSKMLHLFPKLQNLVIYQVLLSLRIVFSLCFLTIHTFMFI